VHSRVQCIRGFRIETLPQQTAKRRLHVAGRAAKAVVKLEVPERGIEIVARKEVHHPAAEPDALRISRSARQKLLGFGKVVLLLRLLGIAGLRLVGRLLLGALGESLTGHKEKSRRSCRDEDTHTGRRHGCSCVLARADLGSFLADRRPDSVSITARQRILLRPVANTAPGVTFWPQRKSEKEERVRQRAAEAIGAFCLFGVTAILITAAWAWLGREQQMPASPLARGEKVKCISYAPFRTNESPLDPDVPVDPQLIEADLAQLSAITDCVRTYSVDHGLDRIPGIAKSHGMKVMQGLWLSPQPERNAREIATVIRLAQEYPDTIAAVIVGNEVLLRRDMSAGALARTIREVKAKVGVPVTYADVWEFWLRNRELANEVDFVTIHILPYWEDVPIRAGQAAQHVRAIRGQIAAFFPGKEVFIGEFGWPSAGRMREGALPSPSNQARTLHEVLLLGDRENYRINLIEAYDQWWKARLEGTVGGHWGLYDAVRRMPKFTWGGTVSDHPHWRWQAFGGIGMAALVLAAAMRRPTDKPELRRVWPRAGVIALISSGLAGWTVENAALETFSLVDALRTSTWSIVALVLPVLGARALANGQDAPVLSEIVEPKIPRLGAFAWWLGALRLALLVIATQAAVALVFDPRYRDFPYAALTAAVVPLLVTARWKLPLRPPRAELAFAITLMLAAVYIAMHEAFANWQACWLAAGFIALACTLLLAKHAQA
jgi:exo-beta-1,3-glucanase (GH17 family)